MFLVDSHCHLNKLDYKFLHKNLDDVLEKAIAREVKFFLTVATTITDYCDARELVGDRNNVAFSCGIHPLNKNEIYKEEEFLRLASEKSVIAIGETGLDYHYNPTLEIKQYQRNFFRKHIRIGCELNKPVIVHTRNAQTDTVLILKEEKVMNCGGVLHCFTEDIKMANVLLDLGLYISFSGIITFKSAEKLRGVVRYVPLDRLLIETDSPYLPPISHRCRENQPAMVRDIAGFIAELKGIEIDEIANITTKNFIDLFNINYLDYNLSFD